MTLLTFRWKFSLWRNIRQPDKQTNNIDTSSDISLWPIYMAVVPVAVWQEKNQTTLTMAVT